MSTIEQQRRSLPNRLSRNSASVRHAHLLGLETPTYDASEEDNDETMSDNASAVSTPAPLSRPTTLPPAPLAPTITRIASRGRHTHPRATLALALEESDSGVDSPTYDGDIESTTPGVTTPSGLGSGRGMGSKESGGSSPMSTPPARPVPLPLVSVAEDAMDVDTDHGSYEGPGAARKHTAPVPVRRTSGKKDEKEKEEKAGVAGLTQEDIERFVMDAIEGNSARTYKVNPPPEGRPIRIYADGVYDIFHFGHALQLRQAKLSFPNVYLLVGVCSDALVNQHKSPACMNHAERCESVRQCKYVDEVVPDAPWVINDAFLEKHMIDYVAHDEEPYKSLTHDDVYAHIKEIGKFLPTRRTPGISTSELLERIVSQYRKGRFDRKLEKMGHAELMIEGSDLDDGKPKPGSRSRTRGDTGGQ
ncbi:hypothetical protein DACRYDRAFT_23020 [Dacryopinax primogenitus]|uniref:choline-phosphate cytidylyltransferase n=1 Tax=Dacryopinax primogenitus (strain DJM 731) TaxID=1858805 RepID=M5FSU8_DACPD|nr:uncharacterized protein DACRYDRAFT_23020 [Dacryopinax primogenitus]EJU00581.1 hypothetical protein DACRYDRAFT_23020 [Dacryopinax primogenitus]